MKLIKASHSLNIKDEIEILGNGILDIKGCHNSGRLIGEVTIIEQDAFGNVLFTSTDKNDIVLPGSIYVLEQMFKIRAANENEFKVTKPTIPGILVTDSINDEKIFGFMVGIGGEESNALSVVNYSDTSLSKVVPIKLTDNNAISANESTYFVTDTTLKTGFTAYYVKAIETPVIKSVYTDGSGDVTEPVINKPISTYAECYCNLSSNDLREYFRYTDNSVTNCRVNTLGLVAGLPVTTGSSTIYKDVRVVTGINFRTRYLDNDENTLKIIYRVYCI